MQMNQPSRHRIHPLMAGAAVSVMLVSLIGVAAMTGVLPTTPGLLGLPRDYLNAQLGAWRTGQRQAQAPDCMKAVVAQLSDDDINAASSWLSAQTVPVNSRAVAQRPPLAPSAVAVVCGTSAMPVATKGQP